MKKIKIIALLFVVLLFILIIINMYNKTLGNFTNSNETFSVELLDDEKVMFFTIDKNAKSPNSMELFMSGEINGTGILFFGWNESIFYMNDSIDNNFEFHYEGDWYNDTVFIKYVPITAKNGVVNVKYSILGSKK
jgi:hypothetical protein